MNRRTFLQGVAAALTAACTTSPPIEASRGLWHTSDAALAIGPFPEFGPGIFSFDYTANRVTPASPLPHAARPVRIDRTPFSVENESASISAELAVPERDRRAGAVLMIYGSGPAPKEAFDLWAFWFLNAGYAVITYDKRGSGASTGDWRLAGLETLAADARAVLAGAQALGLRDDVYAWGASQAGWVMPQLGAQGLLKGIIMHAGGVTSPGAQILGQVEAELRAYGFPEDEIERARAYYALDTDVSRGRQPWSAINAAFEQAQSAGAEWILAPPAAADAPERTMIRLMADFDAAPHWRANTAPVLAIFGGKDWIVPAEANAAALHAVSSTAEIVTLANANHLMFVAETGLRDEYASLSQVHPDYFRTIARWLSQGATR